tara:strand:+ start:589 stop:804 length:216 start_codon:yes stop_codon:yes gene_type:complete
LKRDASTTKGTRLTTYAFYVETVSSPGPIPTDGVPEEFLNSITLNVKILKQQFLLTRVEIVIICDAVVRRR